MSHAVRNTGWKNPGRLYVFLAIFAWNFVLRLFPLKAAFFGIDPDYNIIIEAIYQYLLTGAYPFGHTHDFAYPYFPMQAVSFVSMIIAKFLPGGITRLNVHFIYQAVAALFGSLTVMVVMRFVEESWGDAKLAIFTGVLFSGALTHVFASKVIRGDIFGVFWGACVLLCSYRVSRENRLKDSALAGASLGFAAASHFASFSYAVLIACGLFGAAGSFRRLMSKKILFNAAGAVAAALAFFFIGNWHPIIKGSFLSHTFFTSGRAGFSASAPWLADANNYPSFFWYMEYLFTSGIWYPLFIAACGGLILILLRKRKTPDTALMVLFPLVYMLILARWNYRTDRLTLPLMPYIIMYAAVFVRYLWDKSQGLSRAGLVAFFVIAPVARVALFDFTLFQASTRQQAMEWIRNELPEGSGIIMPEETGIDGNLWGSLKSGYAVAQPAGYDENTLGDLYDRGFDYVVTGGNGFENWYLRYKDYIRDMDMANTRFLNAYYENFYLEKERRAEVLKIFSNPFFESGFFSLKDLEQSSYINHTYNPSIKVAKITGLKRNKIVYDAGRLKATCPFVKDQNIEIRRGKDGTEMLYLGGIIENGSKTSAYNGPYEVYAGGGFEAAWYFKAAPSAPGASIRLYVSDGGGKAIEAREFKYADMKRWGNALYEVRIPFRHEPDGNMQLQFAVSARDSEVYLQRVEVIKKD